MGSHRCNNEGCFGANVGCSKIHRYAEGPLVGAREFFVSQARMRRISNQSFKPVPEF